MHIIHLSICPSCQTMNLEKPYEHSSINLNVRGDQGFKHCRLLAPSSFSLLDTS